MDQTRRSLISALGLVLPFALGGRATAAAHTGTRSPVLRYRSFEQAVREAFDGEADVPFDEVLGSGDRRRIEVGYFEELLAGGQGCHNDRPFAGFPAGHLRIVRVGTEPGRAVWGVRLYVSTVDVVFTGGRPLDVPSRPLDFSTIPPAPSLA